MVTVTLTNQKGGVGKTTTAYALATGLHNKGYKVLMVDLDPQSNLSYTAGVDLYNLETSMYDVFKEKATVKQAIQIVKVGLDIVVGSLELSAADMELTQTGREYLLKEGLEQIQDNYDYCIIDTPPTLGILTVNALTASNKVIIPLIADIYSLQGIAQLKAQIDKIMKYHNPTLEVSGLLLTKYNERTVIAQALHDSIAIAAETLKTKVFDSKIRATVSVQESQLMKEDIYSNNPTATATIDYKAFVDEFLND